MSIELPILSCEGCGACCTTMGHPQFYRFATGENADPHWAGLPQELKAEVNQYVDQLAEINLGEPCIWYDSEKKQCRHYDHRPQMCRDFEMGSFHCRRKRREQGIDQEVHKKFDRDGAS